MTKRLIQPEERAWHLKVLLGSLAVCLLAALLQVRGGRVCITFLPELLLPESCASKVLLGIPCPGCGMTRSFIHLAHGRWTEAFACNALGWLFALLVLGQLPYRAWCLRGGAPVPTRWSPIAGWSLGSLLIAYGLLRLVMR